MGKAKLKTIERSEKEKKKTKKIKSEKKKITEKKPLHLPREILTLSLGSLAIFTFFILFLSRRPDLIGAWGVSLAETLRGLFGISSFFMIPVFMGLAYLCWIKTFPLKIISGGIILFFDFTLLIELFFRQGGSVGLAGTGFISAYLGLYGTALLLFTVGIINFILLTGVRLAKIFAFLHILGSLLYALLKETGKIFRGLYSFFEMIFYVEYEEEYEEEDDSGEEETNKPVKKLSAKEKKKKDFPGEFREALKEEKKVPEKLPVSEEELCPPEYAGGEQDLKEEQREDPEITESSEIEFPEEKTIKPLEHIKTPTMEEIEEICVPSASSKREKKLLPACQVEEPSIARQGEEECPPCNESSCDEKSAPESEALDAFENEFSEDQKFYPENELSEDEDIDSEYDLSEYDEEENLAFIRKENIELALPELSLLRDIEEEEEEVIDAEAGGVIPALLEDTLASFGVKAKVIHQEIGPSITRYELQPAKGVRVNKITSLSDDIALALAAQSVRLEAPIPGKSAIGIEIPNKKPRSVYFGKILSSSHFQKSSSRLTMALGEDITGKPVIGDLAKMPHLLIAGATGAGKSVCLNSIIASILFKARPNEVHFAMIDPKRVELSVYKTIPHLVSINREHRVVVNPAEASELLDSVVREMDDRYKLLADNRVRNIGEFNALNPEKIKLPVTEEEQAVHLVGIESRFPMPYIVVIIDELADLMMVAPGDVEKSICRLAQLARAVGIHLIVATQRPSVNVITGIIKANIPSRISFAVSSQIDSRTILDMAGAEKLIGRGDMLYLPAGSLKPKRVQGAYVSLEAIEKLVAFWENQRPPENLTDFRVEVKKKKDKVKDMGDLEDDLIIEAIDIVLLSKSASVSQLQRALRVGHARAGRLIDIMEKLGVVGPWEGSKSRKILLTENPFKAEPEEEEVGE